MSFANTEAPMDRPATTIVQGNTVCVRPPPLQSKWLAMSTSDSLPPLFDEFPPVSTEDWEAKIKNDLGSSSIDDVLAWNSIEGVSLPGYLRREDLESLPHVDPEAAAPPLANTVSAPANDWQVCQPITHPDPEEANRLARRAVRKGASALALIRPASGNERHGLRSETVRDLRTVLAELPRTEVDLHLDQGPAAPVLLAALQEVASDQGVGEALSGSVGYDPAASLATGTLRDSTTAFDLVSDLVHSAPSSFRALSVDLRPYHHAGASAVQELAYGLGALSDLLASLLDRGHTLSTLLPELHLRTSISTSYFVEIAKLRALRLLVPQVVDAYAAEVDSNVSVAPGEVLVHAETSRRTETIYDPYVNMLRGTTEGMAAVVGGCDVLRVHPYDAALRPEDAFGSRIARNVQLILREEAHLDVVADPGAGSYYLEAATDQLAQRAWDRFQNLEASGGLIEELRTGHVQNDICAVRKDRREEVDSRQRVLVGTNHYPDLDETRLDDVEASSSIEHTGADHSLDEPTLDAFRAALSTGQSVSALVADLADGDETIEPIPRVRMANGIENVRLRTERHAKQTGHTPTVFLAPLGPPKMRSARANFARNVFGVASFDVAKPLKFETVGEAAEAAADANADIIVLCSADAEYPELTPALRSALDDHDLSPLLVIAGNPEKIDADLPADDFIHRGNLLRSKLKAIQSRLGIPE